LGFGDVIAGGPTVRDRAVGAISRADIPQDHEGRGPMLPALSNVGAPRFLAHRVKVEIPHELLELQVAGAARRSNFEPRRLAFREWLNAMASNDLVERLAH